MENTTEERSESPSVESPTTTTNESKEQVAASDEKIDHVEKVQKTSDTSSSGSEDEWEDNRYLRGFFRRREEPEINIKELWEKEDKLTLEERRKRYRCRRYTRAEDISNHIINDTFNNSRYHNLE